MAGRENQRAGTTNFESGAKIFFKNRRLVMRGKDQLFTTRIIAVGNRNASSGTYFYTRDIYYSVQIHHTHNPLR